MDIISRLKQYMDYCQLTSSQFADAAGIPRPTLSQLLNGRPKVIDGEMKSKEGTKKISSDIISKLHDAYPRLNVMWLLFGDGDMETSENTPISEPHNAPKISDEPSQITKNQEFREHILFEDELSDFPAEKISDDEIPSFNFQSSPAPVNPIKNDRSARSGKENFVPSVALQTDETKKVESIMVFYSDKSFEVFKPSK